MRVLYKFTTSYDNAMNTTSQDVARGMRVVELIVTRMVVSASLPLPPHCGSIAGVCVPGHFRRPPPDAICDACPSGKFSAEYAASGCTACPVAWDTQGLAGQSLCWPSSGGSRGPCPRHHCVRGFGQCLPCGCPIDTYADTSPYATSPCIRCSAPGQYTDDLGDCRSCPPGSVFIFNGGCRRCPKYSMGRDCVSQCPPNSYRDSLLSCSACPSNTTLDASGVCIAAAC
jgi:hypothetical protein